MSASSGEHTTYKSSNCTLMRQTTPFESRRRRLVRADNSMSATASELERAVDDVEDCDPVYVSLDDDDDDHPLLHSEQGTGSRLRRLQTRRCFSDRRYVLLLRIHLAVWSRKYISITLCNAKYIPKSITCGCNLRTQ